MTAHAQMAVLRHLTDGVCHRTEALAGACAMHPKAVVKATGALITRGLAERAEIGCYKITEAGRRFVDEGKTLRSGPRGPVPCRKLRDNTLRARLWRAARIKRKFSLADLLVLAARGDERDAYGNACRYCRSLELAGYLRRLVRADDGVPTSNGLLRYALVADTGPAAPVCRYRARTVFDPNTCETHPLPGGGA